MSEPVTAPEIETASSPDDDGEIETASPPDDDGEIDVRGLLTRAGIGIGVILTAVIIAGAVFRAELTAFGQHFVDVLGRSGVFLGFFIPDGFAIPLPQDVFTAFGLVGGLGFWEVVLIASAGSLLGGCCGFQIGRRLSWTRWFRRITAGKGREIHRMVERYGATAVFVAALTPLPYWLGCWSAGALGMPFRPFILVSLIRIPRIAFYLWLIDLGFIGIEG